MVLSRPNFNRKGNVLKKIAINNDYDNSTVDKVLSNKFHKLAISQFYPVIQEKLSKYKTITYNGRVSEEINDFLNRILI